MMNALIDRRVVRAEEHASVTLPNGLVHTCGNCDFEIEDVNLDELRKVMREGGTYNLDGGVSIVLEPRDENNIIGYLELDGETMTLLYGTRNGSDEAWKMCALAYGEYAVKMTKQPSNKNCWCDVVIPTESEIKKNKRDGRISLDATMFRLYEGSISRMLSEVYFSL